MIYYALFLALLLIASIALSGWWRKGVRASKGLLTMGLVLLIGGAAFGTISTSRLESASEKTQWPAVDGIVISSEVMGERAFHPQIKYKYSIAENSYVGVSNLDAPGFGGRNKRLDVAEKLVERYPVGSKIAVYVNESDPAESVLVTHVPWSVYAQLGLGVTIALGGAVILIFFAFSRQQSTA